MFNRQNHIALTLLLAFLISIVLAGNAEAQNPREKLASPGQQEQAAFVAKGVYRVFDAAALPATLYYDVDQKRVWLDIQASNEYKSWAIFDWSLPTPSGYIGNDHQCFSITLTANGSPSPTKLTSRPNEGSASKLRIDLQAMPQGVNVLNNLLIINDDEGVLVFEADSFEAVSTTPAPKADLSDCRPLKQLQDSLSTPKVDGTPMETDAESTSRLARNYPYSFHGAGYHWLKHQGNVFNQMKPDYDAALASCIQSGPNTCKPYWETGGLFGRYGRYCGDGWGTGRGAPVSSADYCCSLHDGQSWDRSGNFGHEARNLCGFAACLTCKYYLSLQDWEINFKGDFFASIPISAFVGPGIAAVWCFPQSHLTGFTCN